MGSVFPHVDAWQTNHGDLMLIGSMRPRSYRTQAITKRIAEEPFKTALRGAWRAVDIEGFFAHFVANESMAQALAAAPGVEVKTDDRNLVEFGFARAVGVSAANLTSSARALAIGLRTSRPRLDDSATINWPAVNTAWVSYEAAEFSTAAAPGASADSPDETARRLALVSDYVNGDSSTARQAWARQFGAPRDPNEIAMLADLNPSMGDDEALPYIERLRAYDAGEADTILATLRRRQARLDEAATALESALVHYQKGPWALLRFKQQAINLASDLGGRSPALARRMWQALNGPFAIEAMREQRWLARAGVSTAVGFKDVCREAIAPLEPRVPWTDEFLVLRRSCYEATTDPRLGKATGDLLEFRRHQPLPLGAGVGTPRS